MIIARSLDELLLLKPKGSFLVTVVYGQTAILVNRPGQPEETIFCLSAGHANQVRQKLSDEGLTGLVEGSL
ncbi:hypothetical protein [Paracoccus actinidiae]|uniref:hypothetical protein n=1 Tax=Paracoccus actinidiae TaxID=3064531 RepID=UPI0027D284D0|nr:hypothetical protein [Paracoccus sp. M09]